jgi:Concanavalin A-like lectin/glucanases superfamily
VTTLLATVQPYDWPNPRVRQREHPPPTPSVPTTISHPFPVFPSTFYRTTILADNPVAYWPMADAVSSVYADDVVAHRIARVVNTVAFGATGVYPPEDTAASLSAGGGRLEVDDSSLWTFTGAFTLEIWAAHDVVSGNRVLMGQSNGAGQNNKWLWYTVDGTAMVFVLGRVGFDDVIIYNQAISPAIQSTHTWHHFVFKRSGSTWTGYVDGVSLGDTMTGTSVQGATAPLSFGQVEGAFSFGGALGQAAIYWTALSPAQITQHYLAGIQPDPVYDFTITWNPGGSTAYDHPRVLSCTITRGRQSEQLTVNQGRCVLVCFDPDGVMNPANAASPLGANLKLMRQVQVTLKAPAVATVPLFTGFVARLVHDARVGAGLTTIEAVDGFELPSLSRPTIAATGATTVGTALGLVLTDAGVPGGSQSLDAGDLLPDFSADATISGLQVIDDVLLVDRGSYVVQATGTHAYRDRSSLFGQRTPVATWTAVLGDVVLPGVDVLNIANKQQVKKLPSGVVQTASDATSIATYRTRQPEMIQSVYLRDDTQAASLASHVVQTRKAPDIPTRVLRMPGMTGDQLRQQAAREIGDVVTLSGLGTLPEGRIEGVQHRIARGTHVTEYTLTARSFVGFTIGRSTIEGPDPIAY